MKKRYHYRNLVLIMSVNLFLATYFINRYDIGFNGAPVQCLRAQLFLIDTYDKNIGEGDLVVFQMNNENEYFPVGLKWIKIAASAPGTTVTVASDSVTTSEGHRYNVDMGLMLTYLKQQNPSLDFSSFTGQRQLSDNEWFVLGETVSSYDSRYWGPINTSDIIGKAYAIF